MLNESTTSDPAVVLFKVLWCNGGGNLRCRISTNPVLLNLIKEKPDIFAYGESQTASPLDLKLDGYLYYLHPSKPLSTDKLRRGIAIFFKEEYKFRLSKCYSCRNYDIVWMGLQTSSETVYFCIFYAPGAHHTLVRRRKFTFLQKKFLSFPLRVKYT